MGLKGEMVKSGMDCEPEPGGSETIDWQRVEQAEGLTGQHIVAESTETESRSVQLHKIYGRNIVRTVSFCFEW